jgi:hypothetical protein
VTGSLRNVKIDGVQYNVAADANVAKTPTKSREAVVHSGGNSIKETKLHGNVEALTLIVTPSELETLEQVGLGVTLSYTLADLSVYTTQGTISLDNQESEEGRVEVTMIPDTGIWDLFAA